MPDWSRDLWLLRGRAPRNPRATCTGEGGVACIGRFLSRQVWQDCRTVISFMMGALICHCTRCSKGGTVGARLKRFEFVVA